MADRKARLAELRKRKASAAVGGDGGDAEKRAKPDGGRALKFRNYQPKTEELKESRVEVEAIPSERITETLEEETKAQLEKESEVLNIVPKKPNWDLKRDVEKKLQKLARRTQRAIAELIQEKAEEEEGDEEEEEEEESDEEGEE